jgi:hypothetical protein
MTMQGSLRWVVAGLLLLTPIASRGAPDPINQWEGAGGYGVYMHSAVFANGTFFVTKWGRFWDPYGQLLTSTNGLNWQVVQLPGYARGLALADNSLIIVGAKTNNTALVMTSSDGTNWIDLPGPTNIVLNGVCYGAGKYLAWGQLGLSSTNSGPSVMLISSNTLDWITYTNFQPYNNPFFSSMVYGDGTYYGMAYFSGEGALFYALYTSTNGFIWAKRTNPDYFSGIAFGNHTFVGPYVASTNGVDFYPVSIPTYIITAMTFGNGTFFTAGWDGTYATSTNGVNWNAYGGAPWGWDEFYEYPNISTFGNSRFIVSDIVNIFRSGDIGVPILSGRRAPPGFGLSLKGEVNRPYNIQISDDLKNWSELMTVTNPLPITEYVDPTPTDSTNRFYRAYLQR